MLNWILKTESTLAYLVCRSQRDTHRHLVSADALRRRTSHGSSARLSLLKNEVCLSQLLVLVESGH